MNEGDLRFVIPIADCEKRTGVSIQQTPIANRGIGKMIEWKIEIKERLAELKLDPTREAEIVEELLHHLEDRCADAHLEAA